MNSISWVLKKIRSVLPQRERKKVFFLLAAMIFGGLLELAGVSAVFPLISIITAPGSDLPEVIYLILPDAVTADRNTFILFLAAALIVIYAGKNLFLLLMYRSIYRFVFDGAERTSTELMELFLNAPYSIYLRLEIPELQRIVTSDVDGLYQFMLNFLQLISECVICLILSILLFVVSPLMTLFLFVILGLTAGGYTLYSRKKAKKLGADMLKYNTFNNRNILDSFSSVKELRILGREEFFIKKQKEIRSGMADINTAQSMLVQIPRPLAETVCIAAVMVIIIFTMLRGNAPGEMVPVLAVFAVAAFRMLPSVGKINGFISNMTFFMPFVNDLYEKTGEIEALQKQSGIKTKTDDPGGITFEKELKLKDVCFDYGNGKKILDKVSLEIKRGESIGVVGESGAGKTTLVDVIMGLLTPESGEISADGTDIKNDMHGWHKLIGYVPQSIYLSSGAVRENVAFGVEAGEIDDAKVERALKQAQAFDFVMKLKDGINTAIGDRGVRLSGGQRQRIGIARALYEDPELLVFDEATAALDGETEKALMDSIGSLKDEHTMIIIAHRLETLSECSRIIEVRDGGIKETSYEKIMKGE